MTPHPPLYAGPPTVPGYVLGEVLGRGSSAVVWAGVNPSGDRVAVKVFAGERPPLRRSEVLRACARELALSQRVLGRHVVRARECLELDDGRVVLVLDVADEGSVLDVVTVRGALPLGEVVTTLIGVATGLADLEAAGVVHGDVAPANVLFDGDGRPVLADLSAARVVEDGRPADVMGTSGFTAPEVLAGRPPTPASDVWSMGALLWYARTGGRTPPSWVGDLHWRLPGEPVDGPGLAEVTEAVGPELWPVVLRMLADDPDCRPSAAEAALAVHRAATAEPVGLVGRHPDPGAAVTRRLRSEAAETRSRTQLRSLERARQRSQRRRSRRGRMLTVVGRMRPWAKGSQERDRMSEGRVGRESRGAAPAWEEPAEILAARRGMAPVGWAPEVGATVDPAVRPAVRPAGSSSSPGGAPTGQPLRFLGSVGGRVALVGGVGAAAAA
ncbi:MAG: serine/threonine-protein kinase, partial [Lapillicoccus sp.]